MAAGFDNGESLLDLRSLSLNDIKDALQIPVAMATKLKAKDDELINVWEEKNINVVVVGGEANGYWRMMGATYRKSVSIDDWR